MLNTIIAPMTDMDVHQAAAELTAAAHDAGDRRSENALNKGLFYYSQGVRPQLTTGGYLVTSATTTNVIYRVSATHGCNCEAAAKGFDCWHSAIVEILEAAQARAVPPTTFRRVKREIDNDQRARQQAAEAALNELYG